VQGGHALAEYIMRKWDNGRLTVEWENGDLVYLRATWGELMLYNSESSNNAVAFYEPDMRGEITAVAMLGDDKDIRFRGFRLM
jgi:hypothetical protein